MKFYRSVITILLIFTVSTMLSSPVLAYNRQTAINYAEQYAETPNSAFRDMSGSGDCTNFTSQCLYAGGMAMTGGNKYDNTSWWYNNLGTWWTWDDSWANNWAVAEGSYNFHVTYSNPKRGSLKGTYPGTTAVPYPSGVSPGDLFYYDFHNSGIEHSSFYVCNGTDPNSGYSGALIDQHSQNRKHAIWSLSFYNENRNTTTIYAVHINS